MITRPKFKDCFHVEVVEPDHIFLLTEEMHWVLSGPVYITLAPLLDGRHTVADIMIKLDGQFSLPQVYYALNQLEAKGYVVEADDTVPPNRAAFWLSLGVDVRTGSQRLAQKHITLHPVGQADATLLFQALQTMAVQTKIATDWDVRLELGAPEIGASDLLVVLTDDYLHEDLAAVNRVMQDANRPWMLVRLAGLTTWVGPIFQPGQTACWACLAQRIEANRQLESFILRKSGRSTPLQTAISALPSTLQMGANLAATEILKWVLQGRNQALEGQLMTLNTTSYETQTHVIVRRPQCPVCGQPELFQAARPIELSPSPKKFTNDGGHRSAFPEETFARYQHHISPITGVVSWLVNITEEVNGLAYSYIAGHNFAMVQDTLYWLRQNLRSRTGGKGMTEIQARVSAIAEAIERYSGVYRGDETTIRESYNSLGPQAIHLHRCLNFSTEQYKNRQVWNAQLTGGRFHVVPNPFDEAQAIDWTPVWSLTHNEFKYLPTAFCYFGHPDSTRFFFCAGDSNGTSAGNTREEAIVQGFLELVERDSVALWWYNRVLRPGVDLDSFGLPYLKALKAYYQSLKRELWVIDITADLQIPAFAAVSRRTDREVEDIIVGFGAHLDAKIALLRAITELNQFLPAVSHQASDGSTRYNFPDGEAIDWWKNATIMNQPYLLPDSRAKLKRLEDYPQLASDDLMEDVKSCVAIAAQAGLETLVLDQTRPDIGMHVCRVVVPGLRHFWRRLGSGRLYDVPVKLGWLDTATLEEELNPYSIFF